MHPFNQILSALIYSAYSTWDNVTGSIKKHLSKLQNCRASSYFFFRYILLLHNIFWKSSTKRSRASHLYNQLGSAHLVPWRQHRGDTAPSNISSLLFLTAGSDETCFTIYFGILFQAIPISQITGSRDTGKGLILSSLHIDKGINK